MFWVLFGVKIVVGRRGQEWSPLLWKVWNLSGGLWNILLCSESNPTGHFCCKCLSSKKWLLMEHFMPSDKLAGVMVWGKCNIKCLAYHKSVCLYSAGICCCGPMKRLACIAIYDFGLREALRLLLSKSANLYWVYIMCKALLDSYEVLCNVWMGFLSQSGQRISAIIFQLALYASIVWGMPQWIRGAQSKSTKEIITIE